MSGIDGRMPQQQRRMVFTHCRRVMRRRRQSLSVSSSSTSSSSSHRYARNLPNKRDGRRIIVVVVVALLRCLITSTTYALLPARRSRAPTENFHIIAATVVFYVGYDADVDGICSVCCSAGVVDFHRQPTGRLTQFHRCAMLKS